MGLFTPLLDTEHSEMSVTVPALVQNAAKAFAKFKKKSSSHSALFKEGHVKKAMMSRTLTCILVSIHSHVASLTQST